MSVATPESGWRVTPLSLEQVDRLVELEAASQSHPWPRQAFLDAFSQPYSRVMGVLSLGLVVAFCNYWSVGGEMQILNLVVAGDHRRQGLASALVAHVVAEAAAAGVVVHLEVRSGNAGAIALYQRFGFATVAVRRRYYPDNGEDAWVMRRDISLSC